MRARLLGAAVVVALAIAVPAAAGDDELAVVVHPATPCERLDAVALEALFTSSQRAWSDGRSVVALNYPPEDPRRVQFDRVVLHMTPEQVGRYWVDQRVRGGTRAPRQVPDPLLALRLVARLPGAVAYVPAALVDDTVRVVARLREGRLLEPPPSARRGAR
jgi:hypothetical protein